jgi:carboxyvinyl-carboxyphosphonate phosphorylmutase
MNWTVRRDRLRAIVEGNRCVFPASVYDGISARLAGDLGFEAMMFAGSVGSFSVLAAPDLCVLTLTEFAQQAYRINRAGALPLCVDADHGYGNALSVKRTVEELETAGVSALTIEDTLLPIPFGGDDAQLISIEEGVGKMRAALKARQDKLLAVVGRTSAVSITGIEDTVARAKAYEAAGVDALFFVGLKTRAQLEAIAGAVQLPLLLGGAGAELDDPVYLAAQRVRICLQGHLPVMAAIRAVQDTLKALRDGVNPKEIGGVAPEALMQQVTRDKDYKAWIKEFLS